MRFRPELLAVAESLMAQIATIAESAMPGALKLCYGESDMATLKPICRAADEAMRAGQLRLDTHTDKGYRHDGARKRLPTGCTSTMGDDATGPRPRSK